MDLDFAWKLARIFAATATSVSAIIALTAYISNAKASKKTQEKERRLLKQQRRIDAWKEINKIIITINNISVRLSPAECRSSNEFISRFNSDSNEKHLFVNLLYHQINLLHIVFLNREFLEKDEFDRFDDWARYTLNCWIEKAVPLQEVVHSIFDRTEFYGDDFLQYLRNVLSRPYRDRRNNLARMEVDLADEASLLGRTATKLRDSISAPSISGMTALLGRSDR